MISTAARCAFFFLCHSVSNAIDCKMKHTDDPTSFCSCGKHFVSKDVASSIYIMIAQKKGTCPLILMNIGNDLFNLISLFQRSIMEE